MLAVTDAHYAGRSSANLAIKSQFCFLEGKGGFEFGKPDLLARSASNLKVWGLFSGLFSDVEGRLSYIKIGSGRE